MGQTNSTKQSAGERNAAVLAVLNAEPEKEFSPSEIARKIGQRWCWEPGNAKTSVITQILQRIGAKNPRRGVWSKP